MAPRPRRAGANILRVLSPLAAIMLVVQPAAMYLETNNNNGRLRLARCND